RWCLRSGESPGSPSRRRCFQKLRMLTTTRSMAFTPRSITGASDFYSAALNLLASSLTRPVHKLTKSPLDIFSTLLKVRFHCGIRFRQMAFLHHCSPLRTPSSVAHMDCHATRLGWV